MIYTIKYTEEWEKEFTVSAKNEREAMEKADAAVYDGLDTEMVNNEIKIINAEGIDMGILESNIRYIMNYFSGTLGDKIIKDKSFVEAVRDRIEENCTVDSGNEYDINDVKEAVDSELEKRLYGG